MKPAKISSLSDYFILFKDHSLGISSLPLPRDDQILLCNTLALCPMDGENPLPSGFLIISEQRAIKEI